MAEIYQLKHPGEQIDELLDKADRAAQRIIEGDREYIVVDGLIDNDDVYYYLPNRAPNAPAHTFAMVSDVLALQKTKIDKKADDYYPQLSVGTADNLAGVDEVARVINFGQSGGGAIADGVARVQSIKGNSVLWNQLAETFASNRVTINSDGSGTISGISSTEWMRIINDVSWIIGHKYSIELIAKGNYSPNENYALIGGSQRVEFNVPLLWNSTFDGKQQISARLAADNNGLTYRMKVTDLTQMFGSGNEPTTIAEFYQRIPMGVDLNAYNEGEVISMRADGVKSVGRNQWTEQWELGGINSSDGKDYEATNRIKSGYIRILANTKYYFKKPQGIVTLLYFYDENKSYVGFLDPFVTSGVGGIFTTINAPYMRFMVAQDTYHHDICLNLSDTDFNGQYEPYIEDSEDLSIVAKYFPNGMRSVGAAHDELRYNKTTNKWEKVVRIGEVDLGTIGYSRGKYGDIYAFSCQIPQADKMVGLANMVCGIYSAKAVGAAALNNMEMRGDDRVAYPNSLYIRNDAYTDTASFKTAMSGVMLYYELAEPIVTEIEEKDFNLDYKVENGGTEEAIAEGKSSALSADITYGFNAVGLIKQLRSLVEAMQAKLASL